MPYLTFAEFILTSLLDNRDFHILTDSFGSLKFIY